MRSASEYRRRPGTPILLIPLVESMPKPKLFAISALPLIAALTAATFVRQAAARRAELKRRVPPPPEGMVLVAAGTSWTGSSHPHAEADETPRKYFLPAFYIDRFEVTNAQFQKFLPTHTFPAGAENLPASGIFKHQAEAYAAHYRKRLPTAAEWEKAARGPDGQRYPWGETFEPGRCNARQPGTPGGTILPVGNFPHGVSPYGCHDMAGNVWEWVSDIHEERPLLDRRWRKQRGILKGGAHSYSSFQARAAYNGFEALDTTCNDVGFRCAQDVPHH